MKIQNSKFKIQNFGNYWLLAIGYFFLFTTGCGSKAQNPKQNFQKPLIPVEAVRVERGSISQTVPVSGNIKSEDEVTIVSKLQAKVRWIGVREGDRLQRGQTLIRLESGDVYAQVKQAQAQVLQAKARLQMALLGSRPQEKKQAEENLNASRVAYETAKKDYERMQVLHSHGSISDQQFDQARTRYEDAKSRYGSMMQQVQMVYEGPRQEEKESAKAALLSASASLDYYKALLSYTRLTSPCRCSVASRMVDVGEMASPGLPLLTLVDNQNLYFEAEVSDMQAALFKPGQPVSVTADGVPEKMYPGRVVRVYPLVDSESRSLKVKIVFANSDNLLRSGMFARGNIEIVKKENILRLEKDSMKISEGVPYVYTVENGKAFRQILKTGISNEKHVEVLSGLDEGDMVVLTGSPDLKEGSLVKIVQ